MSSIIHMGGGSGDEMHLNIFCQPTEPAKKDGIWIQTKAERIPKKYVVRKNFVRLGNYAGKLGFQSVVANLDYRDNDETAYHDRFLWRPFVGNDFILLVGSQEHWGKNEGSNSYKDHSTVTKFVKSTHTGRGSTVVFGGYTGKDYSYSVEANLNAFELDGYFYVYGYYEQKRGDTVTEAAYKALRYDQTGASTESTEKSDKIPFDYFVIGSVQQQVYAIGYTSFKNTEEGDGKLLSNVSLYQMALNGFTPIFSSFDTIPSLFASQRAIAIYENCFYFATKTGLIEYNPATKERHTYFFPSTYSTVPTVHAARGKIFITDMTIIQNRTYLFTVQSKLFSQITHDDLHAYSPICYMLEDDNKLQIFPERYVEDGDPNLRDNEDMEVTAFDLTIDDLPDMTVAI